jgi:tetratricopeptide (TPR) repeat protein
LTGRTALLAVSILLLASGCATRQATQPVASPSNAITVPSSSLYDKEMAQDPVVTYRLKLATQPNNPALHNNLGNLYVLRNWMDEAIQEYRKAIKLSPGSYAAWNNLGTTYLKMGRSSQAMEAFKKAVEINPRYALAWYNIGVIKDDAGDYDGAIDSYLKAISLQPDLLKPEVNPQIVNNRHLMVVRLRRYLEEEGNLGLPLEAMPE